MYELTIIYADETRETVARVPSEQEAIRRGQTFVDTTKRYAHLYTAWDKHHYVEGYTVQEVEE